jgi:hypothetical protein
MALAAVVETVKQVLLLKLRLVVVLVPQDLEQMEAQELLILVAVEVVLDLMHRLVLTMVVLVVQVTH